MPPGPHGRRAPWTGRHVDSPGASGSTQTTTTAHRVPFRPGGRSRNLQGAGSGRRPWPARPAPRLDPPPPASEFGHRAPVSITPARRAAAGSGWGAWSAPRAASALRLATAMVAVGARGTQPTGGKGRRRVAVPQVSRPPPLGGARPGGAAGEGAWRRRRPAGADCTLHPTATATRMHRPPRHPRWPTVRRQRHPDAGDWSFFTRPRFSLFAATTTTAPCPADLLV